jgi:hypothetical protein
MGLASSFYSTGLIILSATGVNFNSANTDTAFTVTLPTGFTRYRVNFGNISHASASISTATCAIYTAAAAGGAIVKQVRAGAINKLRSLPGPARR